MYFIPDNLYHIYNQGNNKQPIFLNNDDYLIFLREIRLLILPHCEIISYCLMPNHFHIIVYTDKRIAALKKQGSVLIDPLSNGIRKLLSGYARIFNKKYHRSGSLFRQKTKSKLLSDDLVIAGTNLSVIDYCTNCFHYVHLNPFKANLVKNLEDWEFSSFKDYAGLRNGSLCNKELAAKFCSYFPANFLKETYDHLDGEFVFVAL